MATPSVSFSDQVKACAASLGFDSVAIARAGPGVALDADFARYQAFIAAGMHGDMTWLSANAGARSRLDGDEILVGARSVVCVARRYPRDAENGDDLPGHRALRPGPRLPPVPAAAGATPGELHPFAGYARAARGSSADHRREARPGACVGGPRRAGLRGQERDAHRAGPGLARDARRGRHHARPAGRGPAHGRALRLLHALPRGLPHPGVCPALRPRRATLRLVPDHRTPGPHRGRAARRRGRQPLRLRRLPDRVPVQRRRGGPGARPRQRRRSLRAAGALVAHAPAGLPRGRRRRVRCADRGLAAAPRRPREPRAQRRHGSGQPRRPRGPGRVNEAAAHHDDPVVREAAAWAAAKLRA